MEKIQNVENKYTPVKIEQMSKEQLEEEFWMDIFYSIVIDANRYDSEEFVKFVKKLPDCLGIDKTVSMINPEFRKRSICPTGLDDFGYGISGKDIVDAQEMIDYIRKNIGDFDNIREGLQNIESLLYYIKQRAERSAYNGQFLKNVPDNLVERLESGYFINKTKHIRIMERLEQLKKQP